MTSAQPDIPALLGSRICHDLISPLGAISNGVELLGMSGTAMGPELELISQSIDNANARIRYFRVAYGAASATQAMAATEVRAILRDATATTKLQITWTPDADMPRDQVKLVFLMLQCCETAMPWGGEIEIGQQNGRWHVVGRADRTKINARLWEALSRSDDLPEIGASEVQFLLLPLLLREAGRSLTLEMAETGIAARF